MSSDWISADSVEAQEFPQLADRYNVYGVPHTVINEVIHIEGAMPEAMLLPNLMTVMDEQKMAKLRSESQPDFNGEP